ncbi:NAD(P)/FAD-dependent oxidoreductase [Seonamhaeicola marinus]|uniref:FAD-binding oxidoreductase n=1 Tax=Seonamhaeicola marinus TaxID=1912246 RepID=A0A5D0HXS1_9FLAO|nr:FAD-dependent oxidoreductase [Seonamhaeicola marinus]TYA74252.1 FAD-binding oxidoreductase [Seonamhaeicola marinus]
MNFSYWEIKTWLSNIDFTIIGSGIVGLNCAIQLKERFPKSNVLVLEKGMLPQGASTKNAGFACFGSLSELVDDLSTHTEQEVINLVKKRVDGLKLLRHTLGDSNIDFQQNGGYELFFESDDLLEQCIAERDRINNLLRPVFNSDVFNLKYNEFKNINKQCFFNPFEGQIDTGKMMVSLLQLAQKKGVKILNNISVDSFSEDFNSVMIKTNKLDFVTSKLLITTNGFASELINEKVSPARAQVLVTKPIKNLKIKGTFHLDRGYYYFRNIDNRILLGGGRNMDIKGETTTKFGQTQDIQNRLEELLKTVILPNKDYEIDHRWSGIMGVGNKKEAIVKQLGNNVFCGVRLGGMGVAIGSLIGKELANLV